ncbi:hypothetical protein PMIN01_06030 [Paraphaeosphaeria minitans]|uniref:Uncharacterized protein n=1 Tax=Paraphaeosphaeria minitans TaxID=565426 RepID=A0A9P6GKM7_9PLEO|nr:hypothetical protein PMIN01_06030 [Paraphaeosphaeria minitans]
MSFYVKRSETARQKELTVHKGARTTTWLVPEARRSVREIQVFHKPGAYEHLPDSQKFRFIFTLEGKRIPVTPNDPQPVAIPPLARHTFKADPTCAEPCKIQIELEVSPLVDGKTAEEELGGNERFFRNLYCYLDDCEAQNVTPSLFQLLLFLHSAEVSLAFPGPGWLARPLSYAFGLVLGKWVGGYILGYGISYPEYYDPSMMSKKSK